MQDSIVQRLSVAKGIIALSTYDVVHPSFLKNILPEKLHSFQRLSNPYIVFKVQRYVRKKLGIAPLTLQLFNHPYFVFLTLDFSAFEWLVKVLGALHVIRDVKQAVTCDEKSKLIQFLSPDTYDFVLRQGDLFKPFLPAINVPQQRHELTENMRQIGHFYMEYLWCQQPEILRQYFVMKMASDLSWDFEHVVEPLAQQQLFTLCNRLLTKRSKEGVC